MGNFLELKVWQLAKGLAVKIYHISKKGNLARDWGLKDQMRRAAISVVSNIAEGDEVDTNRHSVKYFYTAKGSLAELHTQLIITFEIGYISADEFSPLEKECKKISVKLNNLIKYRKNTYNKK